MSSGEYIALRNGSQRSPSKSLLRWESADVLAALAELAEEMPELWQKAVNASQSKRVAKAGNECLTPRGNARD